MKRNSLVLLALCLTGLSLSTACRSTKTKTSAPPPPVSKPAPEPTPVSDFTAQPPPADDISGKDIDQVNRLAQERGWIADAFFGYDNSTLAPEAQAALTKSARWLREHPEFKLMIEGHCDERGTEQYNLSLGDQRAASAKDYLASLGIDRSRMTTISYGEERPFASGSNETAWFQNRRAHLVLRK